MEDEVHSIFDADNEHEEHRAELTAHAKEAIKDATTKVKTVATEHSKARLYPFLPKEEETATSNAKHSDDDHKLLHAIEAAEQAVLHAVQEEVESLFHDTHNDNGKIKTKEGIKKGVEKAKKHVEDSHQERKMWMHKGDSKAIDEYIQTLE